MRTVLHFGIAESRGIDGNHVASFLVLSLVLSLTGLTAGCGAASQAASSPNSASTVPAVGQLRVSAPPANAKVGVPYNPVTSVSGGVSP